MKDAGCKRPERLTQTLEAPAETTVKPKRGRRSRRLSPKSSRVRYEAFAQAYCSPSSESYLNATKSAIAAGYSEKAAAQQGCALMKRPEVRVLIDRYRADFAENLRVADALTIDYVRTQHLEQMTECRMAGDRTNAREHLEDLGRMVGAYDQSLHVDLVVRQEYDERLALEASRVARLLIEDAGARGLGVSMAAGALPEASGVAQDARSPAGQGDDGLSDAEDAPTGDAEAVPRSDNVPVCCADNADSGQDSQVDAGGQGEAQQVVDDGSAGDDVDAVPGQAIDARARAIPAEASTPQGAGAAK